VANNRMIIGKHYANTHVLLSPSVAVFVPFLDAARAAFTPFTIVDGKHLASAVSTITMNILTKSWEFRAYILALN